MSIVFDGVRILGWGEYEQIEVLYKKCIKCILSKKNTPECIVRGKTKSGKHVAETRKIAIICEEKLKYYQI